MDKQELIKKYEEILINGKSDFKSAHIYQTFLRELRQLDEPQKVKVSEEEAKFLETFDFNCESDVTTALYYVSRTGWGYYLRDNNGIDFKDLSEGFVELENRKRLIKAILDGYKVEKEKRYRVRMKGMNKSSTILKLDKILDSWYFGEDVEYSYTKDAHTRKELEKAGFEGVFNSPLFEVEEVTE